MDSDAGEKVAGLLDDGDEIIVSLNDIMDVINGHVAFLAPLPDTGHDEGEGEGEIGAGSASASASAITQQVAASEAKVPAPKADDRTIEVPGGNAAPPSSDGAAAAEAAATAPGSDVAVVESEKEVAVRVAREDHSAMVAERKRARAAEKAVELARVEEEQAMTRARVRHASNSHSLFEPPSLLNSHPRRDPSHSFPPSPPIPPTLIQVSASSSVVMRELRAKSLDLEFVFEAHALEKWHAAKQDLFVVSS